MNFALADGSVRFVKESVDQSTSPPCSATTAARSWAIANQPVATRTRTRLLFLSAGCDQGLVGPALHPASGRIRVGDKPAAGVRMPSNPWGRRQHSKPARHDRGGQRLRPRDLRADPAPRGALRRDPDLAPADGLRPPRPGCGRPLRRSLRRVDRPFGEATIRSGTNDLGTFNVPEVAQSRTSIQQEKASTMTTRRTPDHPLSRKGRKKAPKKVVAMMRGMLGEFNVRVEHLAKQASSEEPAK